MRVLVYILSNNTYLSYNKTYIFRQFFHEKVIQSIRALVTFNMFNFKTIALL